MYCRECGKLIPNNSDYCPYCGKKLSYDRSDVVEEKESVANPYENSFEENNYSNVDKIHQFDDDPFKEFENNKIEENVNQNPSNSSYDTMANLTFFFGLFGLILGSIPLCILSICFYKNGIMSNKFAYKAAKGKKLAIIGLIVWAALIILYAILIAIGQIVFYGVIY